MENGREEHAHVVISLALRSCGLRVRTRAGEQRAGAPSRRENLGIEMEARATSASAAKKTLDRATRARVHSVRPSVPVDCSAAVDATDLLAALPLIPPLSPPPPSPPPQQEFVIISPDGCGPNLFYVEGGQRELAEGGREREREAGDDNGRKERERRREKEGSNPTKNLQMADDGKMSGGQDSVVGLTYFARPFTI